MLIAFLGTIGSGKTLSVVKEIIDKKQYALTNFKLINYKNYHRIKYSDIINKDEIEDEKTKRKKVSYDVNWGYWEKTRKANKSYSIYLDEIHNIIHARRSMSKQNILMSKWVSQIRKILSDSPTNNLYILSQTMSKIDKDFRDLTQFFVSCSKREINKKVYIRQKWFFGSENFEYNNPTVTRVFLGNPYFKYFKTDEMVTFGDVEEFI